VLSEQFLLYESLEYVTIIANRSTKVKGRKKEEKDEIIPCIIEEAGISSEQLGRLALLPGRHERLLGQAAREQGKAFYDVVNSNFKRKRDIRPFKLSKNI